MNCIYMQVSDAAGHVMLRDRIQGVPVSPLQDAQKSEKCTRGVIIGATPGTASDGVVKENTGTGSESAVMVAKWTCSWRIACSANMSRDDFTESARGR